MWSFMLQRCPYRVPHAQAPALTPPSPCSPPRCCRAAAACCASRTPVVGLPRSRTPARPCCGSWRSTPVRQAPVLLASPRRAPPVPGAGVRPRAQPLWRPRRGFLAALVPERQLEGALGQGGARGGSASTARRPRPRRCRNGAPTR
jgi:hypothetical protein